MATMEVELADVGNPFRLQGWAAEFIELTCLGIPYRIPPDVDGQPTIKKVRARARIRNVTFPHLDKKEECHTPDQR